MNILLTVMLKELIDFARDRRTLFMALFLSPIIIPVMLVGISTVVQKKNAAQLEKPLELPVIGADFAPSLIAYLQGHNIVIMPAPADPAAAIREQSADVILEIDAAFSDNWRQSKPATVEIIHDATRQDAQIPVRRVEGVLTSYSQTVGSLRLLARGVSPGVMTALQVGHRDLSTPEAKQGQILAAMLPYLLILTAFLGGAYLVIDSTAGERERQSLEPLLATPASREAVMSGKIAAACLIGLASLLLTMISVKVGFALAPGLGSKADVSLWAIARILGILIPMLLLGTCMLTLIAASVKSVKEAQSYMGILMMVPIIPTVLLMVSPVKNQLWMFAVPFLSQNQMIVSVLRGESISLLQWSIYFGVGLSLGLILWLFASRMYHRERLAISA
jgi:sodium transport system permease protein